MQRSRALTAVSGKSENRPSMPRQKNCRYSFEGFSLVRPRSKAREKSERWTGRGPVSVRRRGFTTGCWRGKLAIDVSSTSFEVRRDLGE
jgi:hypothetical protein